MLSPTPSYAYAQRSQLKGGELSEMYSISPVRSLGLNNDACDCIMVGRRRVLDVDQERFRILLQITCQKSQKIQ